LGIDDFAEALGLAVAGFPILLTVLLFKLSEVIAIFTGDLLAEKGLSKYISGKLAWIPGITLIAVGIWQLIQ
jgi:putative Mn2+ efflux pump MntP